MTAIIGFCLKDGAYLAADSKRTDIESGDQWSTAVKKIENLKNGMIIATAGLGTFGHAARDQVIKLVNENDLNLSEIIKKSQDIFRNAYSESLTKNPGHKIPLCCIIAGQDENKNGFICSLSSTTDFTEFWIRKTGMPYFTGSNTDTITYISSQVIYQLKTLDKNLMFDKWAIESIKIISRYDQSIGFPIQLAYAGNRLTNIFPIVSEGYVYNIDFETDFPHLP